MLEISNNLTKKTATYKAYTIKSFPLRLVTTGHWKLHISISWERHGQMVARPFSGEAIYPTEEEANFHGINFGQRIIDGKVPDAWVE